MTRLALLTCFFAGISSAAQVIFTGGITQSTFDGTGPAVNNTLLNNILTGQVYTVALGFTGGITAPGAYGITSVTFNVPAAPASETSFASGLLTVTTNGANYDLSLLACLTTGSGCASGNQLTANFRILAASLNGVNVLTTGLDPPHPMDLLEDDGVTDIHGSITSYSYIAVPEPSSLILMGSALVAVLSRSNRRNSND